MGVPDLQKDETHPLPERARAAGRRRSSAADVDCAGVYRAFPISIMCRTSFCLMEASLFSVPVAVQRAGLLVLALGCSALAVHGQAAKSTAAVQQTVYVKAGHLFDATSDTLRDNVVLVVEGERISKVAPAGDVSIPAGATVVDLSKAWVLPGLIDCHTHLESRSDRYDPIWDVKTTPFDGGF